MSTTLLTALSSPLRIVAESTPVSTAELPSKVEEVWQEAWTNYTKGSGQDKQVEVEVVKAVLEVVARELTVQPLSEGTVSLHPCLA